MNSIFKRCFRCLLGIWRTGNREEGVILAKGGGGVGGWEGMLLIDREKPRSPSWFFDCHRSRAPNIKKVTACELIGAKKGRNFKFNLFL